MQETIVSIDVETDGPIPGHNSMLSIGAVAFRETGEEISAFQKNLLPLPAAKPNPDTEAWWKTQPAAWAEITRDQLDAVFVMEEFDRWLSGFQKPTAVGYPATFDFMFVYWYLMAFVGRSRLGFQGQDIKTLASAALNLPFRATTKREMPRAWFKPELRHTHVPVDDAREQGYLYFQIRRALATKSGVSPKSTEVAENK